MKQELYVVQRGINGKFTKVKKLDNQNKSETLQKAAYYKWEAAGRPEGNELYFWLEAEKEISK